MGNRLRYFLLRAVKALSQIFYRLDVRWLHPEPEGPWEDLRVIALLNHTSLYEWLWAGAAPNHLLRQISAQAVIPAADITLRRPVIGGFLKRLAPEVIPITRERDRTWEEVMRRVAPDRTVVILPEGRMMRANGLDKHGNQMTVRGGIADILRALPAGRMLLAYSGGLHHVQVPGQRLPKLFKNLKISLEMVEIPEYKSSLGGDDKEAVFKREVIADLEDRRDRYCPPRPVPTGGGAPAVTRGLAD